jgi:hypothetical protein
VSEKIPEGAPGVFLHLYSWKNIDEKISAGRSRMARLECTVAHMGFPGATLNKRIKKKSIHTFTISTTDYSGSLQCGSFDLNKIVHGRQSYMQASLAPIQAEFSIEFFFFFFFI